MLPKLDCSSIFPRKTFFSFKCDQCQNLQIKAKTKSLTKKAIISYRYNTRDMTDPFFLDLRSDPDPFVKSGSTIRSDPFTLLREGSTIRSFPILFDPFRSDHYRLYLRVWFHKSCIFGFSQGARLRDLLE